MVFLEKPMVFLEKSMVFQNKSMVFLEKSMVFSGKSMVFLEESMVFLEKSMVFAEKFHGLIWGEFHSKTTQTTLCWMENVRPLHRALHYIEVCAYCCALGILLATACGLARRRGLRPRGPHIPRSAARGSCK